MIISLNLSVLKSCNIALLRFLKRSSTATLQTGLVKIGNYSFDYANLVPYNRRPKNRAYTNGRRLAKVVFNSKRESSLNGRKYLKKYGIVMIIFWVAA